MKARDLVYIIRAHGNQVRKWDNKTPYHVHPIWCSAMIMQETSLPEKIRVPGSEALLYHDILEDTEAGLPEWLSDEVKDLVVELTFDSSEDEWANVWQKSREVRLLKLYDKVSNLLDCIWMTPERRKQHSAHLRRLCEDVESNYGKLNVVRLARLLL